MGLDIYKIRPTQEKTSFSFEQDGENENKYKNQLFLNFKDFIKKENREFILWIPTFSKKYPELNLEDYELACISDNLYEFCQKEQPQSVKISFSDKDLILEDREIDVIYFEEIEYQRKLMTSDFYNKFITPCWYIDNSSNINEYESNDFVLTADKFKEAQSYAEINSPIKSWNFVEGQDIIYFSY